MLLKINQNQNQKAGVLQYFQQKSLQFGREFLPVLGKQAHTRLFVSCSKATFKIIGGETPHGLVRLEYILGTNVKIQTRVWICFSEWRMQLTSTPSLRGHMTPQRLVPGQVHLSPSLPGWETPKGMACALYILRL